MREELEILQLERLIKIVAWAYEKSSFYQKKFVDEPKINSLDDIKNLPFLTREEIIGNELDILTLPLSSIVRISNFGGVKKFYTRGDLQNISEMLSRSFMAANIFRGSIVEIADDLSDSRLLDALYALESIGATVILQNVEDFIVDAKITLEDDFLSFKGFKLYAPPEIGHAGLFIPFEAGYRVQEDNFLVEILNGELVITTLAAQAMPLIRYKTGQKI